MLQQPQVGQGFTITFRHTTFGKTPLNDCSSRRRDHYLTKPNTHNGHKSKPPAGFEAAIPVTSRRRLTP